MCMASLKLFAVATFTLLSWNSIFLSVCSFHIANSSMHNGFVARLIHRTSPDSPFYNPRSSHEDLMMEDIHISKQRSLYLSQLRKGEYISMKLGKAPISKDFVMNFSIGTPPLQTFAIPDTGSSLFWLQCRPCKSCYKQKGKIYDSRKLSSYKRQLCVHFDCEALTYTNCDDDHIYCFYNQTYMDGSSSRGIISSENFFIEDSDSSESILLEGINFGCGNINVDATHGGIPGVVGLGNHHVSLVEQKRYPSFSYCWAVEKDGTRGWIRFGSSALLLGDSTPLYRNTIGDGYQLKLESISVGGEDIDLSEDFEDNGFYIDSGSSYTHLFTDAFDELINKVQKYMPGQEVWTDDRWELCYEYPYKPPEIVFKFEDLSFRLRDEIFWVLSSDNLYCLAILRNNEISILGMHQQRNFNVGYDLQNKKLRTQYVSSCR